MRFFNRASILLLFLAAATATLFSREPNESSKSGLLWQDPADIKTRDLFYGPGGAQHEPGAQLKFTFVKEDPKGVNPKVVVKDDHGIIWGVKMGDEARPETASSRLVWAVGYFADEDYFLPEIQIDGLPERLKRGQKYHGPGNTLLEVRLKRYTQGEERFVGDWSWSDNPFKGTRELDGLRVMMALLNNWDVTDENLAIHEKLQDGQVVARYYMVGDLGSTLGAPQLTWPMRNSRGNLDIYSRSKFIAAVTKKHVDFNAPAGASFLFMATPREYKHKRGLRWIGQHIPREHAKWIGDLLAQLTPDQIRSAFRAAGYEQAEIDGYTNVLVARIRELEAL